MQIRPLGTEDLETFRDIIARAFGHHSDEDWEAGARRLAPSLAAGRFLGGFDGDRLVGTAAILEFTQWWHGQPVSMGGISAVTVAPEDRGRGIGRQIVTAALERCAELGHVISALYPATTPLYRSLGWEHAGAQNWVELPADALRTVAAGSDERVALRRAGPSDAAEVAEVIRRVHAGALDSGPIDRGEEYWRQMLDDERLFRYLAEDGFLAYRWADGNDVLEVYGPVAVSGRTLRALWAVVGSGSSVATTIRANVAPDDPMLWLTRERSTEKLRREQWMLRVVDAPAAVAVRGFPAGLSAEVPLVIEDLQRSGNSGSWRLIVGEGRGRLTTAAADPAAVHLGSRGLAALYAGIRVGTLRRSGLLRGGDPAMDGLLAAAFAATPFMLDHF
jgi:predicted acetyltransferase